MSDEANDKYRLIIKALRKKSMKLNGEIVDVIAQLPYNLAALLSMIYQRF